MSLYVHRPKDRSRPCDKAEAGRRLADLLRSQILDGMPPPGHPLPSEAELRVAHRAGRNVVRVALDLLRRDGYVSRRPGQGTTVLTERAPYALNRTAGISSVYNGTANRVITRFRSASVAMPSRLVANRLRLDDGEDCLIVDYETLVDREPYSLATSYLRLDHGDDRFVGDLAGDWPGDWFNVLTQLGFVLGELKLRVEAVVADDDSAASLDVDPGTPLMRFERLLCDDAGTPIDFGYSRCRSDRMVLSVEIGG